MYLHFCNSCSSFSLNPPNQQTMHRPLTLLLTQSFSSRTPPTLTLSLILTLTLIVLFSLPQASSHTSQTCAPFRDRQSTPTPFRYIPIALLLHPLPSIHLITPI